MKKFLIIILCILIFVPSIGLAQVGKGSKANEPATKLEAFLTKKGKLIVKNFCKIGEINGRSGSVNIGGLVIYEPGQKGQRVRGLRIEVVDYETANSNVSFIDLEEIKSFSKALVYMENLLARWKDVNKEYTEVVFFTKGNLKIGFYQEGYKQAAFCSSGYIRKVTCFFRSPQDLDTVKIYVDKGLQLLRQK